MTDKEFLSWVADRLVYVYGESESVDFVHKLRKISQRTWVGLTEQDLDYLCNLAYTGDEEFALAVQAKLMEKNA
jgi:hypothetical protein